MSRLCENLQLVCAICRIGIYTCCRTICCKKAVPHRKEFNIICLGLNSAGKTALLSKLSGEDADNPEPTSGFSIKVLQFQNLILNVKEIGGGIAVRPYWERYYHGMQGIIFVLDSSSNDEELAEAKEELAKALSSPLLRDLPCLILASGQDRTRARNGCELESYLEPEELAKDRAWVFECCSLSDIEAARMAFEKFNLMLPSKPPSGSIYNNRI